MPVQFTGDESALLEKIYQDKFAVGAFSGMIFNASLSNPDKSIDELLKSALSIRLRMKLLTE